MTEYTDFQPPGSTALKTLNHRLKTIVETETKGQRYQVWGVASNVLRTPNGHVRLVLRQGLYSLRCIVFRDVVRDLHFVIEDGQTLVVHGAIQVYEQWAELEIKADHVTLRQDVPAPEQLEARFARARAKGWTDPVRKRSIPRRPKRVGLITGEKSVARKDVRRSLRLAGIFEEPVFEPVFLHGPDVAENIASALAELNKALEVDVIIIARGGGSPAELSPFNDELLAEAIVNSRAPVITAIGHTKDESLADLVADMSVPTPSSVREAMTHGKDWYRIALTAGVVVAIVALIIAAIYFGWR